MHRVVVSHGCATPCATCIGCLDAQKRPRPPGLAEVAAHLDLDPLLLGGGDATAWPHLDALLEANRGREKPSRIYLEAPARRLDRPTLERLARAGLHGVVVQIEATGKELLRKLGAADGEVVVHDAEALGLDVEARLSVRPRTFGMVPALAQRLAPRKVWLELVREDWGKPPVPAPAEALSKLLLALPNVAFSGHRANDTGYLPPCALPAVFRARPSAFRTTLREQAQPNATFEDCGRCSLRSLCAFRDREAVEDVASLVPVTTAKLPWEKEKTNQEPVPAFIVKKRSGPDVLCTTPWTTMEVVDPDGRVRQCCSTWTVGDRGNAKTTSLHELWNGEGYRTARRDMVRRSLGALCQPICSRLHDERFSEGRFAIQSGSKAFVDNQLLLAEDMAERREIARGRPLRIALCPSTYCNYDCIMCDHGRSPRRELPDTIWEELFDFLPTLQSLTLLGGEPLANPLAMKFLRAFDVAKFPDAAIDLVTNGSLLTASTLRHLSRCTLGDVTMSLNAGTPEVYEAVQRGIAFDKVLENLDALLAFREAHHRWFGVTVSFVLQPASAHTVLDFARLADARNLRIRLMALNPENHEGLDFYLDEDAVRRVVHHADELVAFCERVRPDWLEEARAGRAAVVAEAERRRAEHARKTSPRHLPLV